jgi:WD40 repeat protein
LSISAECNSVAWSPDGTRLAVAGADGTIRILDPAASSSLSISELLANLTGPMSLNPSVSRFSLHQGEANDVLFTPDGNQIVSCGDDGSIHICEATTGRVIKTLSGHEREVEQLAISPDGKTLASASSDDFLRVWDLQTGTQRHGWTSHPKAARMVAVDISPDGTLVAAADIAGGIIVANIETGATSLTKQVDGIECITFSDDSRRVISGDRGGVIRSCPLDVDSKGNPRLIPEIARFWIGHRDYVTAAAADISDNRVVSGGKNGVLTSWSPGRMCVAWFLKAPLRTAWSDALKFVTARSDCLYVDLSKRRYGNLVDGEEREAIGTATQNSSHLLFEGDGMIAVTDRQTEMQVAQWTFPMAVHSAALSPDGLKVAVADRDERQYVRVYQCGREEPLFEVQAQQCNHLEFSSDGQTLAISAMNDVLLVDAASGSLCDRLQGHQTTVNQAAFSPDQKRLASVGDDRRLTVWHIDQAGQKTQPMNVRAHQGQVNGVDWSPDGRVIATVGGDLFLRLWDADSLQPLFTYRLLESGSAVRFVGDDQLLIPTVNGKLCVLGIATSTDDQL